MKKWFIFLSILIAPNILFSQADTLGRFSFSISGGVSIPVGSFGNFDANSAATYGPDETWPWLIGFSKEKSGFAKIGSALKLEMRYHLSDRWFIMLQGRTLSNNVEVTEMENYLTNEVFQFQTTMDHDNYNMLSITPGVGYSFPLNKLHLDIAAFAGYSNTNYPYYICTIQYLSSPRYWSDRAEHSNVHSIGFGSSLSLSYMVSRRILLGIDMEYFQSSFDYTMINELYPGGNPGYEFHDTLVIKTVNIGAKLGYRF